MAWWSDPDIKNAGTKADQIASYLEDFYETAESAECPYCKDMAFALPGHDPLKKHFEWCPVLSEMEDGEL